MDREFQPTPRLELDTSSFDQGRRAAYRRILGLLKAREQPFVVAGSLALGCYLGQLDLIPKDELEALEIMVPEGVAPQTMMAFGAAGLRVEHDPDRRRASVRYGDQSAYLLWGLPSPLGGQPDDVWFAQAVRARLFDLRVRIAPLEELLWVRMATQGAESMGDVPLETALMRQGRHLDWDRLLNRLAGLESLVLAHVFLLLHRLGEAASDAVPPHVVSRLLRGVRASADHHLDPEPLSP